MFGEAMGQPQRKLKNIIINPGFQIRYIFWLTFGGLSLVLINFLVFYIYTRENYNLLVDMLEMTDEARNLLYGELHRVMVTLIIFSAIFLIFVALWGMKLSHRVAGPLYKLKKTFDEISSGQTTLRVYFRAKDEFRDVAESCNKMLDKFNPK
jgi:methyl-accepting chemotaxis protein